MGSDTVPRQTNTPIERAGNSAARARTSSVRRVLLGSVALALLAMTIAPTSAATTYTTSLGAHGGARWIPGQSVYVNLKALTPGVWKQQLWSGTCALPKIRLAVLAGLVVPGTGALARTTRFQASLPTAAGVVLRLLFGSTVVCGAFVRPSTTASGTVVVVVNGAQQRQVFEGFGATLTIFEEEGVYQRHDPSQPASVTATRTQREAIASMLYGGIGNSRLRVFLKDFEPANDNSDPSTLNPAGFEWTRSTVDAQLDFVALALAQGLRTVFWEVALDTPGHAQAWLRKQGSDCALNPSLIDEDVEWLLAAALHVRDRGLPIEYLGVNNEPDLCPPGYKIEIADFVTIVKRLGARLRAAGLATRIVVSDGWVPANSLLYMRAVLTDPVARQYVGALAFHAYDAYGNAGSILRTSGAGQPPHGAVESRQQIRDLAATYGLPVWMTEVCYCAPQPQPQFEYLRARLNHLHDELTIADVNAFDVMNSFFIERPGVGDELVHIYFRPNGALDRSEIAPYGLLIGQYAAAAPPGSVRIVATSSDPLVRMLAFQRPDAQPALIVLNNAQEARTLRVTLSGLPTTPSSLVALVSRAGSYAQAIPNIPVVGSVAAITVPPLSVTTFRGR